MKELLKKLMEAGKQDALDSLEALTQAAKEIGYTQEQIDEALDGFIGFPLDDDDLEEIAGGMSHPAITNTIRKEHYKNT